MIEPRDRVRAQRPSEIPARLDPPVDPASAREPRGDPPSRLLPGLGAPPRVLIVDDEPAVRRALARLLLGKGFEVDTAEDGLAALALLGARAIDVMLVDVAMPGMSGMALLARAKQQSPTTEVILLKTLGAEDTGAAARAGAYDVIARPFEDESRLALVIERATERRRLAARERALGDRVEQHERLGELLGRSTRMVELHRRALAAASARAPVLILGEPGTGRSLLARIIHRRSARAAEPLLTFDCGAVPPAGIEAELFGTDEVDGVLQQADQGTLFLAAVEALPLPAQHKLAAVLAEQGAKGALDVRILASGAADLRDHVADGRFRQDLFYRLLTIPLEVPPLRRRREDIPLLAYHFLEQQASRARRPIRRLSAEALRALREHPWPGNVRELESAIEHAVVMARGEAILPADLPFAPSHRDDGNDPPRGLALPSSLVDLPYPEAREQAVGAFDRAYVEHLLSACAGNVSEAARRAGMDRSNFRRLMKKALRKSAVSKDPRDDGPDRDER